MRDYFEFSDENVILFKGWYVNDLQGILLSSIGIILLSILYEALKNYREHINVANAKHNSEKKSRTKAIFSLLHVVQTLLQGVQLVIGYLLMFIFMTFNLYLCIAVTIGTVIGYFLFSWKNAKCDITECCS